MKAVILSAGQGKRLLPLTADNPKCLLNSEGPLMFRSALENAMGDASAYKKWYLSVIAQMAQSMPVWTISANGLRWCEIDFPADLKPAGRVVQAISKDNPNRVDSHSRYAVS